MKKISIACLAFAASMFSAAAFGAAGEYWEVTSKMEMPGMPFAMPATTVKVCIPKGGESDPQRTQDKDTKCTFTDVQHSGNTVRYKGTCVNSRGDTMNMTGETTHDSNSFKSKMEMSAEGGKHGKSMTMAMTSSGKRVGGSCDAGEIAKKAQAQAQEQKQQAEKMQKDALTKACDVSDHNKLFTSAAYYAGSSPMCSNKKEYCQAVRDTVQGGTDAFIRLVSQEEQGKQMAAKGVKGADGLSIVRICSLDIAALQKGICKKSVHKGPADFMDKYCSPAEAKEYREFARKQQDCEGRGYTSGEKMKACMGGMIAKEDESCEGRGFTSQEQREACRNLEKCGSDVCGSTEDTVRKDSGKSKDSGVGGINSDTVLQGAKKLKGMFGF